MAVIGNSPATTGTTVSAQSFNGDASTVAFTLNRSVNSTVDLEVLVDNVQQSPYDGSYSVSGTTLTFSSAPASGTNNVYVIYRGATIQTAQVIPDDGSVTNAKMASNAALNNLASGGTSLGRRNIIINGAMQVAQRGTSSTSGGYVSLDRWRVNQSGASTTFSQETFTAGEEIEQSKNYARFAVSTGNDNAGVQQRIEDVTSVPGGESITVSFWAKGTNPAAGSIGIGYNQNFGSGGSADVGALAGSVSVTGTWTKYSVTFTNPSYSGKTIGSNSYWQLTFTQGSDTSTDAWTLDITNVQLEVGTVATPFEHRSYGEELALCQRYCVVQTNANINAFPAYRQGGNNIGFTVSTPVSMRATPTISGDGATNNYQVRGGGANESFASASVYASDGNLVTLTKSGLTHNPSSTDGYTVFSTTDGTGFQLDAEL